MTNPMKKLTFGWRYRREAGNKKSIKSRNLVVLEPLQNTILPKKVAFNKASITTILSNKRVYCVRGATCLQ